METETIGTSWRYAIEILARTTVQPSYELLHRGRIHQLYLCPLEQELLHELKTQGQLEKEQWESLQVLGKIALHQYRLTDDDDNPSPIQVGSIFSDNPNMRGDWNNHNYDATKAGDREHTYYSSQLPSLFLSATDEQVLLRYYLYSSDQVLRKLCLEELTFRNIGFVIQQAISFKVHYGLDSTDLSDIIQEGVIGLQQGIKKFNVTAHTKLLTYSKMRILKSMQDAFDIKNEKYLKDKVFSVDFDMMEETPDPRPRVEEVLGTNYLARELVKFFYSLADGQTTLLLIANFKLGLDGKAPLTYKEIAERLNAMETDGDKVHAKDSVQSIWLRVAKELKLHLKEGGYETSLRKTRKAKPKEV